MCRNIRTLFNFEPPATDDEIRASGAAIRAQALGLRQAVARQRTRIQPGGGGSHRRGTPALGSLETASPTRDREVEAMKARERARQRFA